jgi:hypothetical protein
MSELKIAKVTSVPVILASDTLYFVKTGSIVDIHLSDSTGTSLFKITDNANNNSSDVDAFLLMGM